MVSEPNGSISKSGSATPQQSWKTSANVIARISSDGVSWNTLVDLDLASDQIDDTRCISLCQSLHSAAALQTLNLGGNSISGRGAAALGQLLAKSRTLVSLNLRLNWIGDEGTSALCNGLRHNRTLAKLVLAANDIGPEGAEELAAAVSHHAGLTHLDLAGNKLADRGVEALCRGLAGSAVAHLNLWSNQIGPRGGTALGQYLSATTALTELHVGINHLGSRGAEGLANGVAANTSLRVLDLGENQIGDDGAFAVAQALTTNRRLRRLNLRNNMLSNCGALAVANALLHQPWLDCCLAGNLLSPAEYAAIAALIDDSAAGRLLDNEPLSAASRPSLPHDMPGFVSPPPVAAAPASVPLSPPPGPRYPSSAMQAAVAALSTPLTRPVGMPTTLLSPPSAVAGPRLFSPERQMIQHHEGRLRELKHSLEALKSRIDRESARLQSSLLSARPDWLPVRDLTASSQRDETTQTEAICVQPPPLRLDAIRDTASKDTVKVDSEKEEKEEEEEEEELIDDDDDGHKGSQAVFALLSARGSSEDNATRPLALEAEGLAPVVLTPRKSDNPQVKFADEPKRDGSDGRGSPAKVSEEGAGHAEHAKKELEEGASSLQEGEEDMRPSGNEVDYDDDDDDDDETEDRTQSSETTADGSDSDNDRTPADHSQRIDDAIGGDMGRSAMGIVAAGPTSPSPSAASSGLALIGLVQDDEHDGGPPASPSPQLPFFVNRLHRPQSKPIFISPTNKRLSISPTGSPLSPPSPSNTPPRSRDSTSSAADLLAQALNTRHAQQDDDEEEDEDDDDEEDEDEDDEDDEEVERDPATERLRGPAGDSPQPQRSPGDMATPQQPLAKGEAAPPVHNPGVVVEPPKQLPTVSADVQKKIVATFVAPNKTPSFNFLLKRKTKTGKPAKDRRVTLEISRDRQFLVVRRRAGLRKKEQRLKLSPSLKAEITTKYPKAFMISAPELKEPMIFVGDKREEFLLTIAVFIFGTRVLRK